jgi:DNA-binding response OmpR family regulator
MDIAVIEDHEELREVLIGFLSNHGFTVQGFEDAESSLESPFIPSIYIVDIGLPDMDGYELVSRIRRSDPRVGIIVLSARKRVGDVSMGYRLGADIYLSKPSDSEVILAAITRLMDRKAKFDDRATLFLNPDTLSLRFGEQTVSLSKSESDVLLKFSFAGSDGLPFWALGELMSFEIDEELKKRLEVRITRLRRKIESLGYEEASIKSIRGFGYTLTANVMVDYA